MDASEEVHHSAQAVITEPAASFADALSTFIAKFVGWPFSTARGFVIDEDGNRTDSFACVIHTTPATKGGPDAGGFPADGVAAVIDAIENLDLESLRLAFARIAQAKRLKKKPAPRVAGAPPTTTVTLGILLGQRSDVPLETLGEELDRLNAAAPGRERLDMLVVASTGVINYGVQFPSESVTGDFLPPGEGALEAYTPPMYIVMVMRPSGDFSLNKMMAFLIAHLEIFSPGAKVPRWIEVLNGVTPNVVTLWGYQYNLAGELVRVPREFYNDRYMAPLPVAIEDEKGNLLGLLRFLPWQDGAAILLEQSKLPLDGLLVFLGAAALKRGGIMRLKNSQISYVLPITQSDFGQMLARIQRQSNIVVRPIQPNWTVQKVADEGSSSPLMARLMIGMLRLRDNVFDHTNRDPFDKAYDFVLKSLFSARDAMRQLTKVWQEHERKVNAGEVARVERNAIHVDESVDRELGQEAEAFINAAARAIKKGMQEVAAVLGVNIGFLFQKQAAFEAGVAALQASDPALADYLRQARTVWSELLQDARNAVEHEGWTLPRVLYTRIAAGVQATEPQIAGRPVTEFASFILDRLACFVEEVTAHLLMRKSPALMALAEIPPPDRKPDVPERFRLTLANGGMPPWVISFHASSFDET
jgi:hypothetical protein